ncbi:phosphoribosylamine--glycine ligase [Bhargavaea ginsengi]|uniref:phosphoribosylamine--glycine ligase n=1 Tax=Bhargavaea ginsengi TaxID=426757 RepID=UPI002040900F|nr:phosphoribosylamine--glycine ligase [Bhargavaea ginsengi]MCM3088072.1 phosphoribosylamine--glycine ligase [Bhargavaea ginsengi]
MDVLVIGSGGREHALVRQFAKSPSVGKVYVAPGNDGMRDNAEVVPLGVMEFEKLAEFAKAKDIALTFVGPEQPLAGGIVDHFRQAGLRVFGPDKAAARLEGSKAFAKELMKKYNIPTAKYETFTDAEQAKAYIREQGAPIVIKADGLAAGKGVVVAMTLEEALEAVDDMIGGRKFGDSSARVVIEEFLDGEEFSYMSFVHGGNIFPMPISQDHKRAFDNDEGPNTGGMGAYSPVPHLPEEAIRIAHEQIVEATVRAMDAEGTPFTGILYAGLILTEGGPKTIEFNARFGDPETQVVLPQLKSDLAEFLVGLLDGNPAEPVWEEGARLGVVIAADGYPGDVQKGNMLPELGQIDGEGLDVFHAGTKAKGDRFAGNGGRVILVSAEGETLREASKKAYAALDSIEWNGFFYRSDIGRRAMQ